MHAARYKRKSCGKRLLITLLLAVWPCQKRAHVSSVEFSAIRNFRKMPQLGRYLTYMVAYTHVRNNGQWIQNSVDGRANANTMRIYSAYFRSISLSSSQQARPKIQISFRNSIGFHFLAVHSWATLFFEQFKFFVWRLIKAKEANKIIYYVKTDCMDSNWP